MTANRAGPNGILDAVPGARSALRWYGWLGIGVLIVPALELAVLATQGAEHWPRGGAGIVLPLVGLATLLGGGMALFLTLSRLRRVAEFAQLLCEPSTYPVFVKDRECRYRFVNPPAASVIGGPPRDIIGHRDSDLRPGEEAMAFEENDRVCLTRDLPTLFREIQKYPGSSARSFLVSKRPVHDVLGRVAGLVGVARDISDELQLQQVIRRRADEARAWFDSNPLPVVIFASADLRIIRVNGAAERCYGFNRRQMQHMQLSELFAPEEIERLRAYLEDATQAVRPGTVAWRHRKATGETFEAITNVGDLPREEEPARIMLVRDVSARNATRRALDAANARYEELLESGLTIVWLHDLDGRLLKVNSAMEDALGYPREELLGRSLGDFIGVNTGTTWDDYMARVRSLRRDAGALHVVTHDGEQHLWQYQFVCYPDAEPDPYVFGTAQDVTQRHRHELRMREQQRRDVLTGCHGRAWLEAFTWQATADQVWGCVVVDIDHFRQYNASQGHAAGDALLQELAGVLERVAGSDATVARMGDDHFAVIVEHASEAGLQELTERLATLAREGTLAPFSLGWALREHREPLQSSLRRADKMLFRSRIAARDDGIAPPHNRA
jgi:diguanylate cyclase (GGDEF)-like protein/PAS domain S-box-containing protein